MFILTQFTVYSVYFDTAFFVYFDYLTQFILIILTQFILSILTLVYYFYLVKQIKSKYLVAMMGLFLSNWYFFHWSNVVNTLQFNTTHIELLRGEDATFNISINIPFPCPEASECYLDVKLFDPDEDHDCYDSSLAFINTYTCGQRISGSTNYSGNVGPREITVTTKNNQFYYSKSSFRFRVRFDISGEGEDFWSGTFSQEFTVGFNFLIYHKYHHVFYIIIL